MALIEGYSSSEEEEEDQEIPTSIPELDIFLQNYITNMAHQASVFSCIRWNPSIQTLTKLKGACTQVLRELPPSIMQGYKWVDAERASPLRHHITIHSNYRGKPYQVKSFTQDLVHALPQIPVPNDLIGHNKEETVRMSNLLSLLGENATTSQKSYINMQFESHMEVFPGLHNDTLFLSGIIKKTASSNEFFSQLRDVINQIRDSNGLVPSLFELPPDHQFHVSFQVGENFEKSDPVSLREINEFVKEIDVSKYLKDIVISFDSLDILPLIDKKEQHVVKFNVDN